MLWYTYLYYGNYSLKGKAVKRLNAEKNYNVGKKRKTLMTNDNLIYSINLLACFI